MLCIPPSVTHSGPFSLPATPSGLQPTAPLAMSNATRRPRRYQPAPEETELTVKVRRQRINRASPVGMLAERRRGGRKHSAAHQTDAARCRLR